MPGAELAVVVVDEAILALSNYQLADPLSIFYADRPPDLMQRLRPRQHHPGRPAGCWRRQALAARRCRTQTMEKECGRSACRGSPMATMVGAMAAETTARSGSRPLPAPIRVRIGFQPAGGLCPGGAHRCERRRPAWRSSCPIT